MTTTDHDRLRKLAAIEKLAQKLAGDMAKMREHMVNAQAGIRSHAYDTESGGDRYELAVDDLGVFSARVPRNDPTGEAVITPDKARVALAIIDHLLNSAYRSLMDLGGLHDEWMPKAGAARPTLEEDGPGPDWCGSCWRNNRHLEPVSGRYQGRCRFCGDYRAEEGEDPPLPVLRERHAGHRITEALVARHRTKNARRTA